MKKRSKIIVSILVLFLVMAVGYALFTATLKINGTATASGNMDLTYECLSVDENGGTGTCKAEEDKSITTTSTLTKPTDVVNFVIKVTNTGSIPVVLKDVTSPNNVSNEDLNIAGDKVYLDRTTLLTGAYAVFLNIDSEGNPTGGNAIVGDIEVENANIIIQPGGSIAIHVVHMWTDSADLNIAQPEIPEGGASIDYNLTFEFQQVTE